MNIATCPRWKSRRTLSEISLSKISIAQPVEIQLDAFPEARLLGKVKPHRADGGSSKATVLVKVEFVEKDKRLLPDMSAKVAFLSRELKPEERKSVTALQADTLAKRDGKDVVFLFDADKGKTRPRDRGRKVGDLTKVSGVKAGDR